MWINKQITIPIFRLLSETKREEKSAKGFTQTVDVYISWLNACTILNSPIRQWLQQAIAKHWIQFRNMIFPLEGLFLMVNSNTNIKQLDFVFDISFYDLWFGLALDALFNTDIQCAAVYPKAKQYFDPNSNVSCTNKCVKFSYLLFCLVKVVTIRENNSFKKTVPKTGCRCRYKTYKFLENLLASDVKHLATKYYGLPKIEQR